MQYIHIKDYRLKVNNVTLYLFNERISYFMFSVGIPREMLK